MKALRCLAALATCAAFCGSTVWAAAHWHEPAGYIPFALVAGGILFTAWDLRHARRTAPVPAPPWIVVVDEELPADLSPTEQQMMAATLGTLLHNRPPLTMAGRPAAFSRTFGDRLQSQALTEALDRQAKRNATASPAALEEAKYKRAQDGLGDQ